MGLHIKIYEPFDERISGIIKGYWHATSTDFKGPEINIPDGYHEIVFDLLTRKTGINFTRKIATYKKSGVLINKLYIRLMPYSLSMLTSTKQGLIVSANPGIYDLFDDRAFSDKLLKIVLPNHLLKQRSDYLKI